MRSIQGGTRVLAVLTLLAVAACGDDNGSPQGVWQGTSSDGDNFIALIDQGGDAYFLDSTAYALYSAGLNTSGNSVSSTNLFAIALPGHTFSDDSPAASGSAYGTLQTAASLSLQLQSTTIFGTQLAVSVPLNFNSRLYDQSSSLARVAGSFQDLVGNQVNISASGTLSAQDATTGCVLNGTVSTLDTRYNLYQIQITYSDCQGLSVDLNGQVFIGLATLDNTASPEVLFAMAKATSLTNRYLSLYYLVRSS